MKTIAIILIIGFGITIRQLFLIHKNQLNMAKTQAQLAQELRDLKTQNDKARAEVIAKITALEEAIANAGNTTQEVDDALAALKESVQIDDDMNPDAPVEPPTEG